MEIELLKQKILETIALNPMTFDELKPIADGDMLSFRQAINSLTSSLDIITDRSSKLALPEQCGLVSGKLQVKRGGFGFVLNPQGDIFIEKKDLHGALNGEKVLVKIVKNYTPGHPEGRIIRIEDKPYYTVGTVKKIRQVTVLLPDDNTIGNIKLARKGRAQAQPGQKAVVEITRRTMRTTMHEGKVVEILGDINDNGIDILSIARSYGLKEEFKPEVLNYAASLPKEVDTTLFKDRTLLFDKLIFTIDGDDAKDLDDAVSIEKLGDGSYILGVHIADVSHYVRENSPIDKEALHRGTSVYLIDRVIPMLPKELSNGICSLNSGVVRLTLSCFMKIDHSGNVVSHKLRKTAIKSAHRLTYNSVNSILLGDENSCDKYSDIKDALFTMNELAHILREKRFSAGSLDFDIPEAKIALDDNNISCDVSLRKRGDAEKLIEEFMLICNETVAREYESRCIPFVYRIHEKPEPQRMRELSEFLNTFGYKLPKNGNIEPFMLSEILSMVKDSNDEAIISRVILRSLKKAKYSTHNEGHFGLASECYCHFTSPIRRYPDLQIHRIIKEDLNGNLTKERIAHYEHCLFSSASASSERERNAIEAERSVNAVKMAEYMEQHIGEEYPAIISGVSANCLFAELANTIEGSVPLSSLHNDYYEADIKNYLVRGVRTNRVIRLGDAVKIRVVSASKEDARIEFALLHSKSRRKKGVTKHK